MKTSSLAVVMTGRNGRRITVTEDVMDVCRRLKEIDSSLGVDWYEDSEQFHIWEMGPDGKKRTVKWVQELTPDLIEHVQRLQHEDYTEGMERMEAQADADKDYWLGEQVGPVSEKLKHALRKDLGIQNRIYLPRGI